ncbi:MAG: amidohydrolase [Candidatus Marinimicrobia bacterium]|nr:amidohydrolase [Candidatus Neomarinimicrobiota bacterium]|tara:strand:+ start:2801 stop:4477 length:1677 start_codon:yes stop_codon:yes gene_type:complete
MLKISPFLLFIFSCSVQNVDKIYFNGNIWTGDPKNPYANAIAVSGDQIFHVGDGTEVLMMSTANTEKIDLNGHFVTPGFIDNHVHFMSGGFQLSSVNLRNVDNKAEFQKRIKTHADSLPKGIWMQGGDWDHELWGGNYPDKSWIDDVVSDRPVLLGRLDGHMALANSKALQMAGITKRTKDPAGGIIIKDENGNPTGILKDEAESLVSKIIPEPTIDEMDQALDVAMNYALSLGITQVHDVGSNHFDSWKSLLTYKRNHKNGRLKIRIKIFPWYTYWKSIIKNVRNNGPGDDWLRWDGIKAMMDGSLGSRTAWMHEPYLIDHFSKEKEDLPTVGIITVRDTADFKFILRETDKANIQHAIHAIGDRANDWILDEFALIRKENGMKDRRSRIEHSQHLSKSAILRFSKENIIPSMQPYHIYDDGSWAHKRIDHDRLSRTYVFKTLIESGANLTFGSDWTVAPLNPVTGIYAAVTRRTRDGYNPNGWYPNEKISVEDALKAYTINNAYAAFWDDKTGSIIQGKYADFVVHSVNFLTSTPDEILYSRVLRTVVGGKDYLYE